MQELVSIIIAAFNEEKHIPRLLATIQSQDYPNIETILIDDSSTDHTVSVAEKFNIQVISQPHRERSVQRNFGVSKAKGKYVILLDADMQLSPKVVSSCVETSTSKD